jgi:hypothetical protein
MPTSGAKSPAGSPLRRQVSSSNKRWAPVNVADSPGFASCRACRKRRRGAGVSGGVGAEVFTSSGCSLSAAPGVTGLVGRGVGMENDMTSSLLRGHSPLITGRNYCPI